LHSYTKCQVAFDKSLRTVDPINLTGAWPTQIRGTLGNKRTLYQAVVENLDNGYD